MPDLDGRMSDRELLISLNAQVAALARRLDDNLAAMNARFSRGRSKFEEIEDVQHDHENRIGQLEVFRQGVTWLAMAVGLLVVALLWSIFTGQAGVVFK